MPTGDPGPQRVAGLAAFGRHDLEPAGGKAANLGELVRAGLPVPPGFVVTTAAYREFVDANDLRDRDRRAWCRPRTTPIRPRTRPLRTRSPTCSPPAGCRTIWPPPSPGPIASSVRDAVAVRSSATAEDLEGASFAGQQDTYLNISGTDAVLDAVRRCWASLWTARAMAYRARQGIDPAEVSLAVVVQELVDAASAGRDVHRRPEHRTPRRGADQCGLGLGRGSRRRPGEHRPAHPGGSRADRHRSPDRRQGGPDRPDRRGHHRGRRSAPDLRRAAVLDDATARELAGLGRRIAEHFGAPQDIEWVRDTARRSADRPVAADHRPARPGRTGADRAGRCRSTTPPTSGPASSSSCRIRSPRCSPS